MDLAPRTESNAIGLARTYVCGDCNQVTRNPRLYLQHRRDFHCDPITIHECDLCIYASKHSQKLMRHRRTVHRNQIQPIAIASTPIEPNQLLVGNELPLNLTRPIKTEASIDTSPKPSTSHQPQPLAAQAATVRCSSCKWCSMQAFNKATLIDHIRQVHPFVEIHKCTECNYSHFDRDKFNRHQRYHTLNYIQCKICDFRTIYKWNLERHMKHHIDGVPINAAAAFKCGKCNFTASTKQSITAHEIGHHDKDKNEAVPVALSLPPAPLVVRPLPSPMQIKMEPKEIDEECAEMPTEEAQRDVSNGPFDVTEFLELVWGNAMNRACTMEMRAIDEMEDGEETGVNDLQNAQTDQTNFFMCCNCNFRNEIPLKTAGTITKPTSPPPPTLMTIYRCGFCHQTSNWKHVIERHCRLLHNSVAFIERYNNDEKVFQNIEVTSTKRKRHESPSMEQQHMSKAKRPYLPITMGPQ